MLIASFLATDAIMVLFFGRRYLRWGAGLRPEEYRITLEKIAALSMATLILMGLAELTLALGLHRLGWNLTR